MKNAEHAEHNIFQTETVAVNEGKKRKFSDGDKDLHVSFSNQICLMHSNWGLAFTVYTEYKIIIYHLTSIVQHNVSIVLEVYFG
jgi:hypothetical protein